MDRRTLLGFIPVSVLALAGVADAQQPRRPGLTHPGARAVQPANVRCQNCKYWTVTANTTNNKRFCKRYPPGQAGFPEMASTDWCGEFVQY